MMIEELARKRAREWLLKCPYATVGDQDSLAELLSLVASEARQAEHLAAHRTADAHDCAEMEEECARLKARLAKVVEILKANRDSANRCLDEPDHPAWVHAQAHATVSVCETALAAAQPEEE